MLLHERLTEAGFEHYEISNFARSGRRARHNANYWQGVPYLGIGPAAHGFDGRSRRWNVASVERYLAGEPAEEEQLSTTDRINEYLMTRLRTSEGFSLADFEARFGKPARKQLEQDARQEIAHERLFSTDERLFIPPQRMLISDDIISSLFAE